MVSIIQQPMSQLSLQGSSVTFSIVASGISPISYQWFKGGVSIVGAVDSSYILAATGPTDAGDYHVNVTDSSGTVVSVSASLEVSKTVFNYNARKEEIAFQQFNNELTTESYFTITEMSTMPMTTALDFIKEHNYDTNITTTNHWRDPATGRVVLFEKQGLTNRLM